MAGRIPGEAMSELSNRDLQDIKDLHDLWIAKEVEGDAVGVLELCTDDVQWLAPGLEILVGKDAARNLLVEPSVEIREIQTGDLRIRGSGSFAYKTSTYSTRYAADGSSEVRVISGTHLWILRKTDGQWQVALVTWQPATT